MSDLLPILIVLILIVIVGAMVAKSMTKPRPHYDPNGLLPNSMNLQPVTSTIQNMANTSTIFPNQNSAQAINVASDFASIADDTMHTPQQTACISPGSQPDQICSLPSVLPGCPTGQQYGGMTIMQQDLFPGSYLPAAIYNTSAFVPGCNGIGFNPDPCFN